MLELWQSLIAGLLGLLAGLIAFGGALIAACWQVKWMRRQLTDAQAARAESDERRRTVVKMAVRAEGRRLDKEVARVRPLLRPRQPFIEKSLLIESSPLLRGDREDAALLGDTLAILEKAASTLNNYTHQIETAISRATWPELPETSCKLLDELASLADKLKNER